MSRYYRVNVECTGIPLRSLQKIMTCDFGWEEMDADGEDTIKYFEGEGYLCGGQTEEEAHKQIKKTIKSKYPKAKVKTIWTYLENLPNESYGDDIE